MVQLEEELLDLLARRRIEVARRLVGEDQAGTKREGARHGHALLLPSRELGGPVHQALLQPDALEERQGASPDGGHRLPRDQPRQHDVLERGEVTE